MTYKVLDLFSGIGGFSLGLERTGGFETVAFCEIEEYPRRVLAKHWPTVPIYNDVRTLTADTLQRDGIAVDVICGGFPCQDISLAGKRAGIEGERSGLWGEYRRLIGELRPKFVIVENVPGILSAGAGRVLGELAALGFDCLWECIPASAVGAPHRRDRWWAIACAGSQQHESGCDAKRGASAAQLAGADTNTQRRNGGRAHRAGGNEPSYVCDSVSNSDSGNGKNGGGGHAKLYRQKAAEKAERSCGNSRRWKSGEWDVEPKVGRVANGVPFKVDRLKALGNAVVPQIPEMIGRAILAAEAAE